jgi:energy-coupling factor transport system permease protein
MGDSIIHRLDPRTKLLCCVALIVAAVLPGQPITILLLDLVFVIAVFICLSWAGPGVERTEIPAGFLFAYLHLSGIFQQRHALFSWGIIEVSRSGVYLGITTFLRLVLLYLGSSLLTMTTSSLKLSAGLEKLLSPLAYLRFPVQQLAMIINLALRFIPTLMEEAELISRAQRARGASFDTGPLGKRLKTTVTVLIPLLGATLQRADDLALALESRCYTADKHNHSRLRSLHFSHRDGIAMVLAAVVFLLPALYICIWH